MDASAAGSLTLTAAASSDLPVGDGTHTHRVRDELIANFSASLKETDLFKVGGAARPPRACAACAAAARATLPPDDAPTTPAGSMVRRQVYQTDELKNLDAADTGLRSALTKTLKLRSWLYSEAFRGFVRAVTGCGARDQR